MQHVAYWYLIATVHEHTVQYMSCFVVILYFNTSFCNAKCYLEIIIQTYQEWANIVSLSFCKFGQTLLLISTIKKIIIFF